MRLRIGTPLSVAVAAIGRSIAIYMPYSQAPPPLKTPASPRKLLLTLSTVSAHLAPQLTDVSIAHPVLSSHLAHRAAPTLDTTGRGSRLLLSAHASSFAIHVASLVASIIIYLLTLPVVPSWSAAIHHHDPALPCARLTDP